MASFDNAEAADANSASGAGTTSLTGTAWTVAAIVNRVVLGFICTGDVTAVNPTGMKWQGAAGTALTQFGSSFNIGTHGRMSAWQLVAPASGSAQSFGNWASTQGEAAIPMASYTGVNQSTPISGSLATALWSTDGAGAATGTVNVPSVAGQRIVACFFQHNTLAATNPLISATGGATARYTAQNTAIGGFAAVMVTDLVASGASTTMSASITSADISVANVGGVIAFALNDAPTGNPPVIPLYYPRKTLYFI